jgi:hypothetical protein
MKRRFGLISVLALLVFCVPLGGSAADNLVLKLGNIYAPTPSASLACERSEL